jgi:hypothetical protein
MNFFDQRVAALGGTRAGDPAINLALWGLMACSVIKVAQHAF